MSIKSILVAYSGDARSSGAVHLAILMAHKYDAHLTAVVPHAIHPHELRFGRRMNAPLLELLQSRDSEAVDEIRAAFIGRVAAAGLTERSDFVDLQLDASHSLSGLAQNYDITLMERRAFIPGQEHFGVRPEGVVVHSGRPIILVPSDYSADRINDHALVAWDGKRAATRALGDAMHILQTKARVTLFSAGRVAPPARIGDDILKLLERHGIHADRQQSEIGRGGIARTLLEACRNSGAGLLVMGAYEHSRLSEEIMGGVTAAILREADLPVFLSH